MLRVDNGLFVSNENFCVTLEHREPSRVIISVPHDGLISNDFTGLFMSRAKGVKGRDKHVWPIVQDIVLNALGRTVQVDAVRLLMPRAYIDGNRELPSSDNLDPETQGQTALDDFRLTSVYRRYHGEIARLVQRSIHAFGIDQVLLIDMHGFGKQPDFAPQEGFDLILGTANRVTVPHADVDNRLAYYLRERGYEIFLPGSKPVRPQGDPYSAGHTTRFYAREYGINAIQIETCPKFRSRDGEVYGKQLATDISEFFVLEFL
ncbi:MAG: hypothetical protein JWN90_597 [Parcubacteria group bacterium]|nr:hypothetical protein [Parcubacteria group bacterium]